MRRGPNDRPKTLGDFVRLDWSMRWSCDRCDITVRYLDMEAARDRYGADYSLQRFMGDLHCEKCGTKIGLLTESPEDRAEAQKLFGMLAVTGWRGKR
jgi:hypothetical protein